MKLLYFILTIPFIACKKQEQNAAAYSYFPNEVGNQWRYKHYQIFPMPDTFLIDVNVIGTKVLSNGELSKIWIYRYPNFIDTNFVVSDSNEIKIYQDDYGSSNYYLKMLYKIPLHTGSIWVSPLYSRDTTKVLTNSALTVPAGTFDNTFKLSRRWSPGFNSGLRDSIWFTPGIGMIKLRQSQFNLGPVLGNGIWELTGYNFE